MLEAENLMLEDDIPAVQLEGLNFKDPVLVLIPAGEVIYVDRTAASHRSDAASRVARFEVWSLSPRFAEQKRIELNHNPSY
jgi:hypothetical protein